MKKLLVEMVFAIVMVWFLVVVVVAAVAGVECNNTRNSSSSSSSPLSSSSSSSSTKSLKRGKRYLDFILTSRMFFRANVKNNLLKVNQLWAYSYGFRANYPIENDIRPKKAFKRDIFQALEDLMDGHGFDGRACILKSFCTVKHDVGTMGEGMLFKLLRMILNLKDHEKQHFPYLKEENCEQILHNHCPLSFNNLSPYTDAA